MEKDKIQRHIADIYLNVVGWRAVEALIEIGKPAVPYLIEVIKFSRKYEMSTQGGRIRASKALGLIGDPSATKALAKNLGDKSTDVQYETVRALVRIGKLAVPHLIKALKLRNADNRYSVVSALGKIGDPSAINALSKVALKDKVWKVRKNAGEAIKQIGD